MKPLCEITIPHEAGDTESSFGLARHSLVFAEGRSLEVSKVRQSRRMVRVANHPQSGPSAVLVHLSNCKLLSVGIRLIGRCNDAR